MCYYLFGNDLFDLLSNEGPMHSQQAFRVILKILFCWIEVLGERSVQYLSKRFKLSSSAWLYTFEECNQEFIRFDVNWMWLMTRKVIIFLVNINYASSLPVLRLWSNVLNYKGKLHPLMSYFVLRDLMGGKKNGKVNTVLYKVINISEERVGGCLNH